jgi:hypothetical protein
MPQFRKTEFLKLFSSGDHFISQNVLRTTLLLSPLKANCLRSSITVCDMQFTLILYFFCVFWTNVQSKRTTRAEPEDHLWSADHGLRNPAVNDKVLNWICLWSVTGTNTSMHSGNHSELYSTADTMQFLKHRFFKIATEKAILGNQLMQCLSIAGPWHLYRAARGKYFIMEIF